MYNVDTGQARTDLYGINKGLAQVIDLSPTRRANEIAMAQQQKNANDERAKEEQLLSNLSALDKSQLRPNDLPDILNMQKSIYEDAKKRFAKGSLTVDDQVELEMQIANLKQQALLSGSRKAEDILLLNKAVSNPNDYNIQEEIDAIQADLYSPERSLSKGGLGQPIPTLTKDFDTQAYIRTVVRPILEDVANKGSSDWIDPETGQRTTYTKDNLTPEESEKLFNSTLLKNPNVFKREARLLRKDEEATKKYGDDVNAYIRDKYFNQFLVNRNVTKKTVGGDGGSGSGSGNGKTEMVGTFLKTPNGADVLSFDTAKPQDNSPIDYVKDGKTYKVRPQRIEYSNYVNGKPTNAKLIGIVQTDSNTGDEYSDGGEMELDFFKLRNTMNEKYGLQNVFDPIFKNEPSNWRIKRDSGNKNNSSAGSQESKQSSKPTLSVSEYNKAKGKNYTKAQIEQSFGKDYTIVD